MSALHVAAAGITLRLEPNEKSMVFTYRAMPEEEGFTGKNVTTRRAEPDEEAHFFP